ncbi:MAG: DoxX family protein [Bacteroidota bacterium]
MKSLFTTRALSTDLAALLLRLILGGLFIFHGYDKIVHYQQYSPMMKDIIGIGAKLSYNLVMIAEFAGGLFVALGFLTRLSVIPLFIVMAVAYFVAHAKDAFLMKELPFTFLLLCIPVFILGSGRYSADSLFQKRKPSGL